MTHRDVVAVMRHCRAWGVPVEVCGAPMGLGREAPFSSSVGCCVADPRVYVRRHAVRWALTAPRLLHELSHVIQGVEPRSVLEIHSGMLYFEWRAARLLGLTAWETWMTDYGLLDGPNWSEASREEKRHSLGVSRKGAQEAGLFRGTRMTFERVMWDKVG